MASTRGLALLHFEPRYRHAGHYLLYAKRDLEGYAQAVATGRIRAPHELVEAAQTYGMVQTLVAELYPGRDRHDRKRMRARGGLARLCPVCRSEGTDG